MNDTFGTRGRLKNRGLRTIGLALLFLSGCPIAACGWNFPDNARNEPSAITVAAASDLSDVVNELSRQFAETGNVDVAILALLISHRPGGRNVLIDVALHKPILQILDYHRASRHAGYLCCHSPDVCQSHGRFRGNDHDWGQHSWENPDCFGSHL